MRYLILVVTLFSVGSARAAEMPNILWIFAEDTSPWMGCYGHKVNAGRTPNIDSIAAPAACGLPEPTFPPRSARPAARR